MRLLLGSGGFRTPERIERLNRAMVDFLGHIERVLFVPYALADHDRYVQTLRERTIAESYAIDGIQRHADANRAIREAQAIWIGGGNTFRLLDELIRRDLIDRIRQRVESGVPYIGISAGTNVACPTIQTTNDMPIAVPSTFQALGLVPFQINPHYFTGQIHVRTDEGYQEHFGETRDERLNEFHEMNDVPVLALWEAGILRREDQSLELMDAPARLFQKGQAPQDYQPGARLDFLLAK